MGKFKEIDLDKDNYVFIKKSTYYILTVLLLVHFICCFFNNAERYDLKEKNIIIEQDRTELITENKQLQEENKALKNIIETKE